MQTVKFNYQNISVFPEESRVRVVNKHLFLNTDVYDCAALLYRDGKKILEMPMEVSVAPLGEGSFELPFGKQQRPGEYAVTVSFRLKAGYSLGRRGHEVAFGQYVYQVEGAAAPVRKPVEVIRGNYNLGVRGEEFDVLFSHLSGGLVSYRYGGVEMLKNVPMGDFWRAPTDNDAGNGMAARYAQWKIASLYSSYKHPQTRSGEQPAVEVQEDQVKITYKYWMPTAPAASYELEYTVFGDGTVRVKLIYDTVKELGDMPLFGVTMKLDAEYDRLEWYGMGPQETYSDKIREPDLAFIKIKWQTTWQNTWCLRNAEIKQASAGRRWQTQGAEGCCLQEIKWNFRLFPIPAMNWKTRRIPMSFRLCITRWSGPPWDRWAWQEMIPGAQGLMRSISCIRKEGWSLLFLQGDLSFPLVLTIPVWYNFSITVPLSADCLDLSAKSGMFIRSKPAAENTADRAADGCPAAAGRETHAETGLLPEYMNKLRGRFCI